jgi:hypothetical protein
LADLVIKDFVFIVAAAIKARLALINLSAPSSTFTRRLLYTLGKSPDASLRLTLPRRPAAMAENQPTDEKFQLFAQCQVCIIVHPSHLDDEEATKVGTYGGYLFFEKWNNLTNNPSSYRRRLKNLVEV